MSKDAVLIRQPSDLRSLSLLQLEELAQDIRQKILTTCLQNGGHLGASLGAVEIAIALLRTFDSPREPIIWDVGHQAYAHKLLTGRWDAFETLRRRGGISGFLSRDESEHDVFGAGHSSTALSAALAMAWARGRASKEEPASAPWTVAVVGDGGLTAGLAAEALNNVRSSPVGPLLLVLNDNQMSISENVGALHAIFSGYKVKEFFELYGFDYLGPLNGHDLASILPTIEGIREHYRGKPVVLHLQTQKGKGYAPAEELPSTYHGIAPMQSAPLSKLPDQPKAAPQQSFSDVFGQAILAQASRNDRVVAVTAAMAEGTGLAPFAQAIPERFFDVGIAEPHAVTFAAGLATQGYRPVVAIYSTFLQRSVDAIIHDVAIQRLPVVLAVDRAGIVGADGPTHHGAFDLVYLSMIPGLTVLAPSALEDLPGLLSDGISSPGPVAIRYPRGSAPQRFEAPLVDYVRWHARPEKPLGILVAFGATAARAVQAVRGVDQAQGRVACISTVAVKPFANAILEYCLANPGVPLITIEDGVLRGGAGEAFLAELGPRTAASKALGYPDRFLPHGTPAELEDDANVSAAAIRRELEKLL